MTQMTREINRIALIGQKSRDLVYEIKCRFVLYSKAKCQYNLRYYHICLYINIIVVERNYLV